MKCICGYYYLTEQEILDEDCVFWDDLFGNNGRKEFIKVFINTESFEGVKPETNRQIYACPKCGALKIEVGK